MRQAPVAAAAGAGADFGFAAAGGFALGGADGLGVGASGAVPRVCAMRTGFELLLGVTGDPWGIDRARAAAFCRSAAGISPSSCSSVSFAGARPCVAARLT